MGERRRAVGAALAAFLVGATGVGAAAPARAAGPRVGVVVAAAVNLSEAEADRLATRLGDALRKQLEVDVIAGVEARRRLPAGGIRDDCVARPGCVQDVAMRLDGDELLFLFLARIGPRVQIDVTWADPESGTLASRAAVVVEGPASEDRAFALAPRQLLPRARPRAPRADVKAADRSAASASVPDSFPVTEPPAGRSPQERAPGNDRPVRRITIPVVVAGAVAAAALGTGVGFGIAAQEDHDSLEEDGCARIACSGVEGRVDQMERRALVADVLFATAGIAGATSVILALSSGEPEPRAQVRVGVGARADGAVVSFAGKF